MIVQGIEIVHFRNIEKASLEFSPRSNLVVGRNAQGKTNLLEAIHIFSLGRSFRTRQIDETIRFGEEYAFLRLAGRSDAGVRFRIEIGIERGGGMRVSVGGRRLGGISEIIGVIPSVIFVPEDVSLSAGPPGNRRGFIDYTAVQVNPEFLSTLKEYRRLLKQRNSLLRTQAQGEGDRGDAWAWDDALASSGAEVVRGRTEVLGEIGRAAARVFGRFVPGGGELGIEYLCSFERDGNCAKEVLRDALARSRDQDARRGYTLVGPHCDDIELRVGDEPVRRYGSQGRKRVVAVALKLAQAAVIRERRGETPVMMLDDIFSELDDETVSRMREIVRDGYQSFVTSPRREAAAAADEGGARFAVEAGRITEDGNEGGRRKPCA